MTRPISYDEIEAMLGIIGDYPLDVEVEFRTAEGRTCVADFALALTAVDGLLAKYSVIKQDATGAKWRGQSSREHLLHSLVHGAHSIAFLDEKKSGQEEDLLSTACRSLMALQLYLEAKAAKQEPPKA